MDSSKALNNLEQMLFAAQNGLATMDDFLAKLVASQICVPSSTEVEADGTGMNPVVYDRDGVGMVAAFTDGSRIGPEQQKLAGYYLQIDAAWFIKRMPPNLGIVLFAGPSTGCELLPHALAEMRAKM